MGLSLHYYKTQCISKTKKTMVYNLNNKDYCFAAQKQHQYSQVPLLLYSIQTKNAKNIVYVKFTKRISAKYIYSVKAGQVAKNHLNKMKNTMKNKRQQYFYSSFKMLERGS